MITDEMRDYRNIVKYKIENMDIMFNNGDVVNIESGMITHLYIEKDFDSLYFPIINVSAVMKDELYDRINKENETVQFRLKIIKNIYDQNNKFLKYELYCNKMFRCFMDKENIIKDNKQLEDKKKTENSESANFRSNNRNFYLFSDEVINCKKILNLSVEDADLTDLIVYLFGECNVDKLLMTKLDNRKRIQNLTIPSGNLIETINYIDDLKGLYSKGTLLFFDIDCAYLIDKNSLCTSWRKNEVRTTHIHIADQKSSDSQLNGQYINKDRKQTHIFAHTDRVQVSNINIINDQINGNNITMVDAKNNTVTNIKGESTQVGKPNSNMVSIKSSNQYTISSIKTRLSENECICNIAFIGLDINVFTPNKELLITYTDVELNKKYGGNYRISKLTATLKKDSEELVGEVQVLLKKQS